MNARDDWDSTLQALALPPGAPVIVHASLSAFGWVAGGAQTIVSALLRRFAAIVMPTFTYSTMLTPEVGPPDNGLTYGAHHYSNAKADFFTPMLPADRLMGVVAETLRQQPGAVRSHHPILSFTGVRAAALLKTQTLSEPLAPIAALASSGGWVLLLGVDHRVNTSVHHAERLAGRSQFVRWALTGAGVVECPGFPGCSDGFGALAAPLAGATRQVLIGGVAVQAVPLSEVIRVTQQMLARDPLALLCEQSFCERCTAFRKRLIDHRTVPVGNRSGSKGRQIEEMDHEQSHQIPAV